jgi:hypothetical protein
MAAMAAMLVVAFVHPEQAAKIHWHPPLSGCFHPMYACLNFKLQF